MAISENLICFFVTRWCLFVVGGASCYIPGLAAEYPIDVHAVVSCICGSRSRCEATARDVECVCDASFRQLLCLVILRKLTAPPGVVLFIFLSASGERKRLASFVPQRTQKKCKQVLNPEALSNAVCRRKCVCFLCSSCLT